MMRPNLETRVGRVRPLLVILSTLSVPAALADFGDYVDPTFECPAKTTCPNVCVANLTDCPVNLWCDGANETLCPDGRCIGIDDVCSDAGSPCPFDCASFACAKTIDFLPACQSTYADWYANASACAANEVDDTPLLTFKEPGFIFCYCWMCCIAFIIFAWCFANQVVFPVRGSTKILDDLDANDEKAAKSSKKTDEEYSNMKKSIETATTIGEAEATQQQPASDDDDDDDVGDEKEKTARSDLATFLETDIDDPNDGTVWTQTGFRRALLPFIIYLLVLATLIGIHVLLTILTLLYYVQQGVITILPEVFQTEQQALKAFEIAWGVGFAFSFTLQWPYSVDSLFLRRCRLAHATHVAIFTPRLMPTDNKFDKSTRIAKLKMAIAMSYALFTRIMALLFCDMRRIKFPGKTIYVPVETDEDGTRFFFFRYSRYNYDPDQDRFTPGVLSTGNYLGDFIDESNGLTEAEVIRRRGVVGPNALRLVKPNLFRCIYQEFCKPFYTYQYFMVWTWFPYWYYYMALVDTFVITTGGLTVASFRYRQDRTLYKLSEMHGEVTVLRDDVFVTISQTEVVPGDVIVIKPGPTHCDMVLVSSDGILVDESALTGESTLVSKKAIDPSTAKTEYNRIAHKKHTIFAGTAIIECNEAGSDLAVVCKTGSATTKGKLLRDILSYERHQFKFDTEVRVVIFILFLYAVFGFVMVSYFLKNSPIYAFFYGM